MGELFSCFCLFDVVSRVGPSQNKNIDSFYDVSKDIFRRKNFEFKLTTEKVVAEKGGDVKEKPPTCLSLCLNGKGFDGVVACLLMGLAH